MVQAQTHSNETPGQTPWTRDLARDLFPGRTTPFGWTLLREPAETAMRQMWAAFGIAGLPQTPFWQYGADGYVRLNAVHLAAASWAAQGAAWLGAVRGNAPTGFAARLRPPAVIRRTEAEIQTTLAAVTALNARLFDWRQWVRGLRWTQADLLQVMEELEPNALAALQAYFTLRAGLEAARARLEDAAAAPGLLAGLTGLPSVEAVRALAVLSSFGTSGPAYEDYLVRYGHRGARDVTPAAARWQDHPARLRLALETGAPRDFPGAPDAGRGREAALQMYRDLARGADVAWDSIALVMAAAQSWIGAAAVEAAGSGLISDRTDVLLLELEELKQVATGEWHGGKREAVQEQIELRRTRLDGPKEAATVGSPRPAGGGQATGSVVRVAPGETVAPQAQGIVVTQNPDAGWTDHWFSAAGLVSAAAEMCSPGMIVAQALGLPAVIGAAEFVDNAETGATIYVDGDTGQISSE